jgi:formamidopyrimidine-DNA glycosylase
MPELPEVEGYRRYLEGTTFHQKITGVDVNNEGRMLRVPLTQLREASIGHRFVDSERIGKFLFLQLSNGKIQLWHFGLTGEPKYLPSDEEAPRFARITFHLENGFDLAFSCMRKFGYLKLIDDIEAHRKEIKLGVDAQKITKEAFTHSLQKKRTMIKPALLQQNVFAGVGNWIADEMLFQTRLHPEMRCHTISESDYHELYDRMQEILTTAIGLDAHYKEFPAHFMVERRWQKGNCPRCETELFRFVVGGRGTFVCPNCQVLKS